MEPSRKLVYGKNIVVFDVETTGCQFGGPNRLRLTVGVAWSSITQCLHTYLEEELGYLAVLLDGADTILAWNSSFDTGVLELYFDKQRVDRWRERVLDVFEVVRCAEKSWIGLGATCEVNHRPSKSGSGLDAIYQWNDGKVDELAAYCATDVIIIVDLLQISDDNESFWFCAKRYNFETKLQEHTRVGSVNKRTWEVEMGPHGSYPPDFDQTTCPCAIRARETVAKRKLAEEVAA